MVGQIARQINGSGGSDLVVVVELEAGRGEQRC